MSRAAEQSMAVSGGSRLNRDAIFRMAAALLQHEGCLSYSDIAALPGVESGEQAQSVYRALLRSFDAVEIREPVRGRGRLSSAEPAILLRFGDAGLEDASTSRPRYVPGRRGRP